MAAYYPPAGFHFTVKFAAFGGNDASFSEVSGLDAERGIVELKEGGENRYSHRLPERAKFANLVLKRGVVLGNSGLGQWCKTVLEGDMSQPIKPLDLDVILLDAEGQARSEEHTSELQSLP